MSMMILLLIVSSLGAVGVNAAPLVVELKPAAIALDSPPTEETQRSCVLYDRGGGMNVLSAAATDPAIGVDLREGSVPGMWIVTATIPAEYQTAGKDPVEILVQTDLPGEPVIRIPIRVWAMHNRPNPAWLERAKALIGRPAPMAVLNRLHGGQVEIGTEPGKVTAVVFSAHWCGHCSVHVPIIEKVAKEYMSRDVRFVGVAGSSGSDVAVEESVATWGVTWPVGVDYDRSVLTQYGVRAFPVVFLLDREGIVQAVHGRMANTEKHNGLDNLETELRGELDLLLLGRTRADFPKVEASPKPVVTSRPAAERPASAAVKVAEVRAVTCKPGATAAFSVPVRNVGMRPLNLLKLSADEGVKINPAAVKEVAPNGVAMLRCEVVAPAQAGPFSRQVTIETNDPRTPVVKVALSGTVSERRVAKPAECLLGASAVPRQVTPKDHFGASECAHEVVDGGAGDEGQFPGFAYDSDAAPAASKEKARLISRRALSSPSRTRTYNNPVNRRQEDPRREARKPLCRRQLPQPTCFRKPSHSIAFSCLLSRYPPPKTVVER